MVYQDLLVGDRTANLERAIACYQQTLRFYTPESAPFDYARTQTNLGTIYQDLSTGTAPPTWNEPSPATRRPSASTRRRAHHLSMQQHRPTWAMPTTRSDRGSHSKLTLAIACYQGTLRFYTPESAPFDYARTQANWERFTRTFRQGTAPPTWNEPSPATRRPSASTRRRAHHLSMQQRRPTWAMPTTRSDRGSHSKLTPSHRLLPGSPPLPHTGEHTT
jgi:hypothetical protein